MGSIKPLEKNKLNCENCSAGYVVNGDPSQVWQQQPWGKMIGEEIVLLEFKGLCEFCKKSGKYSLANYSK